MRETSITLFFGDRERAFQLTAPMILELERLTGAGVGAIFRRLTQHDYRLSDMLETIRLGLIGGGTAPEEAKALVDTYAIGRPIITEVYPVALGVLEALFVGTEPAPVPEVEPVDPAPFQDPFAHRELPL